MNSRSHIHVLVATFLTVAFLSANPIPIPPPACMPLENMHIDIRPDGNGLEALFSGEFTFTYIPSDVTSMLFPMPPDAHNIQAYQDEGELGWTWSGEEYPTVLPEMSTIPMIEWGGPFPEMGAILRVDYEHDLIERQEEFIFFYAVGTGKYFPTYEKTTTANFDILLPAGFAVRNVWLDKEPHEYEVIGSHLLITVESHFGPITKDLVVSLVPEVSPADFVEFAEFAEQWGQTGCTGSDWCDGADRTRNGAIDMNDLKLFADEWLESNQGEGGKLSLSKYYTAYDGDVVPGVSGYSLPLNLYDVSNYAAVDQRIDLDSVVPLLEQNGLAVMEYDFRAADCNGDDIVKPYTYLRKMDVPLFVTSDTVLHLYHIQFDETLKDIEEREFFDDIRDLTGALLDEAMVLYDQCTGDLQETARRNVAYLTVAQKLIDPEADVPQIVADDVASELAKIDAHAGFAPSDIFIYREDYSQYVPRGHYTRSEQLKRYFRTLMWYGRMAFLLKGAENWGPAGEALISTYDARIQTMQAVLLARSIEHVQVGQRTGGEIWDRIYAVTAFYVGLADDLTPYEYMGAVDKVFGNDFVPTDLLDGEDTFLLKAELALLRSPKIFGGTGNAMVIPPVTPEALNDLLEKTKGMRFMGQRFIPDSYMFQHLVFPAVLDYTGSSTPEPFTYGFTGVRGARCYPRGLDVMVVLGSPRAHSILLEEGDMDYIDYDLRRSELEAEFDAFDIETWNRNLYWGWLYSLKGLIGEFPEGYPSFMRTEAWQKKELNAALASWTELRHDTILYAKQSYTPVETSVPPEVTGYVEPVPEFYGRLLALSRMTREGLTDLDALSEQAEERLANLENILSRLIEIAEKELRNEMLADEDYDYIRAFGDTLEGAVLGVEGQGLNTILVADVHTHTVEGKVLEEGVGYVDLIIVACPLPGGGIFLAAGPVLSYYEFKYPMDNRLTDEAWRDLLDSPESPDRPAWYRTMVR